MVDRDDVKFYEDQQRETKENNVYILQEGPIVKIPMEEVQCPDTKNLDTKGMKRPEKRSSVSTFFNKLSKAVLKPRNVYSSEPAPGQSAKRFAMFGKRKTTSSLSDKENMSVGDALSSGKCYSTKEYRKMKQERVKAQKGK